MKKTLISIILDESSQKKVKQLLSVFYLDDVEVKYVDWVIRCDHVTLVFGIPTQEQLNYVGKQVELKIDKLGHNDNAIAAHVVLDGIKSNNKNPHITMAFDPITGKGGFESNSITQWNVIPELLLSGTIKNGHKR